MSASRHRGLRVVIDGPASVATRLRDALVEESSETFRTVEIALCPSELGWRWGIEGRSFESNDADLTDHVVRYLDLISLHGLRSGVLLHAGAVSVGGRAVVVCGESRAGKSTLVASLARAGAHALIEDDTLEVDEEGRVRGTRNTVRLRRANGVDALTAADLGVPHEAAFVPASILAFVRYTPGHPLLAEPVTAARAAHLALSQAFSWWVAPARSVASLASLARTVVAVRLTYGDSAEAARWLLDRQSASLVVP